MFGGGNVQMPPPPPAYVPPPKPQSPEIQAAGQTARQRAAAAIGSSGTILTGPAGLTNPANTAQKTLLGQ